MLATGVGKSIIHDAVYFSEDFHRLPSNGTQSIESLNLLSSCRVVQHIFKNSVKISINGHGIR